MPKPMTIQQFLQQFPTDDACLDHLFRTRFGAEPKCPKCGEVGNFHKLAKLPAYTCNCGHHIHPMVGTPFYRSRTPLQKWFYAMYLFTTTRNGLAAKEIQRQLGVTYKCAWRMGHKIREYMAWVDGDALVVRVARLLRLTRRSSAAKATTSPAGKRKRASSWAWLNGAGT